MRLLGAAGARHGSVFWQDFTKCDPLSVLRDCSRGVVFPAIRANKRTREPAKRAAAKPACSLPAYGPPVTQEQNPLQSHSLAGPHHTVSEPHLCSTTPHPWQYYTTPLAVLHHTFGSATPHRCRHDTSLSTRRRPSHACAFCERLSMCIRTAEGPLCMLHSACPLQLVIGAARCGRHACSFWQALHRLNVEMPRLDAKVWCPAPEPPACPVQGQASAITNPVVGRAGCLSCSR
jgi:hypothetical protein